MDDRHADLQSEALVEIVAEQHLGDGTVQRLVGVVRNLVAVLLQRAEVRELLGDAGEKTSADFTAGLVGGINGAKITGDERLGTSDAQNCKPKHFHSKLHGLGNGVAVSRVKQEQNSRADGA